MVPTHMFLYSHSMRVTHDALHTLFNHLPPHTWPWDPAPPTPGPGTQPPPRQTLPACQKTLPIPLVSEAFDSPTDLATMINSFLRPTIAYHDCTSCRVYASVTVLGLLCRVWVRPSQDWHSSVRPGAPYPRPPLTPTATPANAHGSRTPQADLQPSTQVLSSPLQPFA